jgi:hypothetical protein
VIPASTSAARSSVRADARMRSPACSRERPPISVSHTSASTLSVARIASTSRRRSLGDTLAQWRECVVDPGDRAALTERQGIAVRPRQLEGQAEHRTQLGLVLERLARDSLDHQFEPRGCGRRRIAVEKRVRFEFRVAREQECPLVREVAIGSGSRDPGPPRSLLDGRGDAFGEECPRRGEHAGAGARLACQLAAEFAIDADGTVLFPL